jgi:hypothetical protein
LGFNDETWWSRFARPRLHAWMDRTDPVRLIEQCRPTHDPDPKALACYGLLVRRAGEVPDEVWLRFVDGRPVSALTTEFLSWSCAKLAAGGAPVLLLVWDNASWHISAEVRAWAWRHNRQVKQTGQGVRLLLCRLPVKSPWLNPIEPHWVHGKRNVAAADRLLSAAELADRVCAYFACDHDDHLTIPEKVA